MRLYLINESPCLEGRIKKQTYSPRLSKGDNTYKYRAASLPDRFVPRRLNPCTLTIRDWLGFRSPEQFDLIQMSIIREITDITWLLKQL